jgi:hypothetical protein
MKKRDKILFIEGTSDTSNGDLRRGFHKLFEQKLKGKMPRIVMGDGKNQAINKFLKNRRSKKSYLLVDLDSDESNRNKHLVENDLAKKKDLVFFMIQEMEAWFISQADILDKYYKEKISSRLSGQPAKDIPNPASFLENLTAKTNKGKYHKVKHGAELLEMLNAYDLEKEFEDFSNLIKTIEKDS